MFETALQCLSVSLWEWHATARTVFQMSDLVMVDSHMKLPTISLYGQPPPRSPSSLGPSSTPGVAGKSGDEAIPKTIQHVLNKRRLRNVHSPQFPVAFTSTISVPSLFVGDFTTSAAWKSLRVSSDPAIMNGEDQFYVAVHNHAKHTRVRSTLPHTVLYHGLY